MNYRHNANNVSLERRAPSVGIKSGSPARAENELPSGIPRPEESSLEGRNLITKLKASAGRHSAGVGP